MSGHHQRLVVYLLGGALACFVLWRLWQDQVDLQALIVSEQRDDQEEEALACVRAHEGREDIRDMAERTYRRNAETLIGFSTNPEQVRAYEAQVELDVAEIRAELPNPDCSLTDAKAVITNQEKT